MEQQSILVVHDGRELPAGVARALEELQVRLVTAPTRSEVWDAEVGGVDCAVIALDAEDARGSPGLIQRLKRRDDNLPVIVLARSSSLESGIEAMKAGAFDYLPIPVDAGKLKLVVQNAFRLYALTKRIYLLENQLGWRGGLDDMVGHSARMQEVFSMITMVAKSNATVLITGESGTGKELVARAIHHHSARSGRIFLDINCGHCHSATGPAITSGLWLDAQTQDRLKLGFCKQPIAAGKGTGNRLHDIEPGNAAASIFEFRMDSVDPAIMMPEVGRSVVHREGVQLIRDWINAQPGSCGSAAGES